MDIKNPIWKISDIVWVKIDEKPYLESIKLLLNSDIHYEFRTTIIKWIHTFDDIEEISKYITGAKNYYLQNFQSWKTLKEDFEWKSFNKKELNDLKNIVEKYVENVEVRD